MKLGSGVKNVGFGAAIVLGAAALCGGGYALGNAAAQLKTGDFIVEDPSRPTIGVAGTWDDNWRDAIKLDTIVAEDLRKTSSLNQAVFLASLDENRLRAGKKPIKHFVISIGYTGAGAAKYLAQHLTVEVYEDIYKNPHTIWNDSLENMNGNFHEVGENEGFTIPAKAAPRDGLRLGVKVTPDKDLKQSKHYGEISHITLTVAPPRSSFTLALVLFSAAAVG